ncbi:MAG: hypothetical protein ABIB79_04465 [archaeon]
MSLKNQEEADAMDKSLFWRVGRHFPISGLIYNLAHHGTKRLLLDAGMVCLASWGAQAYVFAGDATGEWNPLKQGKALTERRTSNWYANQKAQHDRYIAEGERVEAQERFNTLADTNKNGTLEFDETLRAYQAADARTNIYFKPLTTKQMKTANEKLEEGNARMNQEEFLALNQIIEKPIEGMVERQRKESELPGS